MDSQTPRVLPDGEELVFDPDSLPARLHPLDDDDPRAASMRRRQAAVAGRLGDHTPRPATWPAPRKPSEG